MARNTNTASARKSSSGSKSEETMLKDLFIDELKDIYWAEKNLVKALGKMQKSATSEELSVAFQDHRAVTEEHVTRLEQVFDMLELAPRAKKCEAMAGLIEESNNVLEELPKGTAVRDAGLIIGGQKVEHYEIAAYSSLVQL